MWAQGKQHGHGVYRNRKGEEREGEWVHGKPQTEDGALPVSSRNDDNA